MNSGSIQRNHNAEEVRLSPCPSGAQQTIQSCILEYHGYSHFQEAAMQHTDDTFTHLLAMYFSPLALPHEEAAKNARRKERVRIHEHNMLHVRPYMRLYIHRSANLLIWLYVAFIFFVLVLPSFYLATAMAACVMLALFHTVFLIFLQQEANDIAASRGMKNPEVEDDDDRDDSH